MGMDVHKQDMGGWECSIENDTVKHVWNDHLYNKIITCDLYSNVF